MNIPKSHLPFDSQVPGWRSGGGPAEPAEPIALEVTDPTTGTFLASVLGGGVAEARHAVGGASAALATWSNYSTVVRAHALREAAASLRSATEDLATLISLETGKRLAESRAEVGLSAEFFEWFADVAATARSQAWHVRPGVTHHVETQPLGVVAVLTPWNFPLSIPARKLAAALAAGCTALFKPSEVAPLSGLRLAEILEGVLPPGVVETLVGPADAIAGTWLEDSRVRGLTFTGSTRVGRVLASQVADKFVRSVFELGGCAPFVVLGDADLTAAVNCLAVAKFRNNGQSCIAANTAWVPRRLLDQFVGAFAEVASSLAVGDPLDEGIGLGPTCMPSDPDRLASLVEDAQQHGAMVVVPRVRRESNYGKPVDSVGRDAGFFVEPVICVCPDQSARVCSEEIFGPVLAVVCYDEVEEVIAATNRSPFGLAGYVCGRDETAAQRIARRLDVGIAGVNTGAPNTPQIPFAPRRDSGLGVEGGWGGFEEFVAYQSVAVQVAG